MYSFKPVVDGFQKIHLMQFIDYTNVLVPQFEILNPKGEQIAIVTSEGEAETLVSHLNR